MTLRSEGIYFGCQAHLNTISQYYNTQNASTLLFISSVYYIVRHTSLEHHHSHMPTFIKQAPTSATSSRMQQFGESRAHLYNLDACLDLLFN